MDHRRAATPKGCCVWGPARPTAALGCRSAVGRRRHAGPQL